MSREFRSRDKKVQKMTKDGLVEINQSTSEEQRISQRGQDFQLSRGQPEHSPPPGSRPSADAGGRSHRAHPQPEPGVGTAAPSPYDTGGHSEPGADASPTTIYTEQPVTHSGRPSGDVSRGPASSMPEDMDGGRAASERPARSRFHEGAGSSAPSPSPERRQGGTKYSQRFAR